MARKTKKSAPVVADSGPPRIPGGKGAWKIMDRGSILVAGLLAERVSKIAWKATTGRAAPTDARHPEVKPGEAVAWAVIGGALVELTKVMVRRGATTYWVKSTGELPPGMRSLQNAQEPVPKEPAPHHTTSTFSLRNRGR